MHYCKTLCKTTVRGFEVWFCLLAQALCKLNGIAEGKQFALVVMIMNHED